MRRSQARGTRDDRLSLSEAVEIRTPRDRAWAQWCRYEQLPGRMHSVRRVKRIDGRRLLWDVDVAGRQLVWEARILEEAPGKRVRWESSWGPSHAGEVRFEAISPERTRLRVEIEFQPEGPLQWIGARCGLVALCVRRDLEAFRREVEAAGTAG